MKPRPLYLAAALLAAGCAQAPTADMPHLETRDGMTKLIVDGSPFICVAGEVANTSSSDPEAMKLTIPRLAKANFNTILTVVSWDLVEPQEGRFDFSVVDYQIKAARENHVRLILLWMGSWKNGLSHFPPAWVKADQARFPRVANAAGNSLEILSTLGAASRDADARAFAAVMRHVRQVDSAHTVVGIQVENEVGVMGSTRDFSPAAQAAFAGPVPAALMSYLQSHKEQLRPELKKVWLENGGKTSGTWEEVFGKSVPRAADDPAVPNSPNRPRRAADFELLNHVDEIFMAWNYAQYIGHVAAEGKKAYPLPMYVNTWLVQANDRGAGDYPSGGPEPFVHDIWRAGAPAIDILAPDIYLPEFAQIVETYARNGNPAFIPEGGPNGENAWMAFTQLNALCYSPFGIDATSPESGLARTYALLNPLSGAIAQAQGRADAIKLIAPAPSQLPARVQMGNYTFEFLAPRRGRGGAPVAVAPATAPDAAPVGGRTSPAAAFLSAPYIVVVRTGPDEFYFATNGSFPFRASSTVPGETITAPATIDRGGFVDGHWITTHRLNGDDLMGLGYDVSAAAADHFSGTQIPLGEGRGANSAGPTVMRVRFYHYK